MGPSLQPPPPQGCTRRREEPWEVDPPPTGFPEFPFSKPSLPIVGQRPGKGRCPRAGWLGTLAGGGFIGGPAPWVHNVPIKQLRTETSGYHAAKLVALV